MPQFDTFDTVRQLEAVGLICKTVTINFGSIPAAPAGVGTGTVAVAGLTPQHRCFVQGSALPAPGNLSIFGARCVTPGTLTVDVTNGSAAPVDLASQTFTLFAIPGDLN